MKVLPGFDVVAVQSKALHERAVAPKIFLGTWLAFRSSGRVEMGLGVGRRILSSRYTPRHARVSGWGELGGGVVFPAKASERFLYEFLPIVGPGAHLFEKEVVRAFVPRNLAEKPRPCQAFAERNKLARTGCDRRAQSLRIETTP